MSMAYLCELKRLPFAKDSAYRQTNTPQSQLFCFGMSCKHYFFFKFEPLNTDFDKHTITHAVQLGYMSIDR